MNSSKLNLIKRKEEQPYTIEKIVGKRSKNGKVEYCLKWKGLDEKLNTWKDADVIEHKDLINKYEIDLKDHILKQNKVYIME